MTTIPVPCKSTRYGTGCGHPVEDHLGGVTPNAECCCCNGQHNMPGHQEDCIECHRRRLGKPGMTAGEFAELLPEHLRGPYWRSKIGEYFREQGIDPDEDDAALLAEASSRESHDTGVRHNLHDVIREFGLDPDEIGEKP